MRIIDMPEFKDKSNVLTFDLTTKVADAIDDMAQKNYGAALITDKGKLAGIFTERDLLRRIAAGRLDINNLKLKDVMTTNIKTALVDDNVSDCLRRMSQGRFRHLPVVDDKGNLLGMLSQGDFVAYTMSDAIHRASEIAKAEIDVGNSTPISIVLAIIVYTLMLLFLAGGAGFWIGN